MKFFRIIRRLGCAAAALLLSASVCLAEEAFQVEDRGLDLTADLSIHYPVVSGPGDAALLTRVNDLIQEQCGIRDYLSRAALLISGGSLRTEWKGGVLGEDVFSCAVSAAGEVESTRSTFVWTGVTVDLRDGHTVSFGELFTDEAAAREKIEAWLEETVEPELSAHLQNSGLLPLPDTFLLESAGLTLLYPLDQLSTLSDRAGDIRVGWHVLRDVLDLEEGSVLSRAGAGEMITLSDRSAARLRASAAEGTLDGIPVKIGDSMQELTDRYHMLTDPDGYEGGRLFALEGGCFRGVYLLTDDLGRGWDRSTVQGIRLDDGCLWGLCVGETRREDWLSVLGEPDGSAEVTAEKAEANRMEPGVCDYYTCGEYQLQLYSDENGTLAGVILAE